MLEELRPKVRIQRDTQAINIISLVRLETCTIRYILLRKIFIPRLPITQSAWQMNTKKEYLHLETSSSMFRETGAILDAHCTVFAEIYFGGEERTRIQSTYGAWIQMFPSTVSLITMQCTLQYRFSSETHGETRCSKSRWWLLSRKAMLSTRGVPRWG